MTVPPDPSPPEPIYHLAIRDEWRHARDVDGAYRGSTLGRSLADEGFVHCSFAPQVQRIADLLYRDRRDVVLLMLDPSRLRAEVRVEALDGGTERFPHVYGPLPVDAVVAAHDVPVDGEGRLSVAALLRDAGPTPSGSPARALPRHER